MKKCFVIMPFKGHFDGYYKNVIKPCMQNLGYNVSRADEIYSNSSIIEDIFQGILEADLIISDITGQNPNVSYELGFAHGIEKPVILITQEIDKIPFDNKHLRAIEYDPLDSDWQSEFITNISKTVKHIVSNPKKSLIWDDPRVSSNDTLNAFLKSTYEQTEVEIAKDNTYWIDSTNGDALIEQFWEIKTKDTISHQLHSIIIDKPGKIEILEVFDTLNYVNCQTVEILSTPRKKSYIILFNDIFPKGSTIKIKIKIKAENYLSDLIQNKEGDVFHSNTRNTKIFFTRKKEKYIFDNIETLKNLKAQYINHPNSKLTGKFIIPSKSEEHLIIDLDFSSEIPTQKEFGAKLTY